MTAVATRLKAASQTALRVARSGFAVAVQAALVAVIFLLIADGVDFDPGLLVALALLLASPRNTWTLAKRLVRGDS